MSKKHKHNHGKSKPQRPETRRERIKRQFSERGKVFSNQIKAVGKAAAYQSHNRSHMTNGEWSCDQLLKDVKKQYPQVDYEFQYLFHDNKNNSKFFIIDFYIKPPFNIAIEIDGGYHDKYHQARYDAWRQEIIQSHGIRVLRYRNQDVCLDFDRVKSEVIGIIESSISHSQPRTPVLDYAI